jgi:hypothetical protein
VLTEPVSPELVLVDPELARRERAKLEERAQLRAVHEAEDLRRAVERTLEASHLTEPVPRRSRATTSGRRVLAAALFCSLLANGLFVAKLVAPSHDVAPSAAVVPPTLVTSDPRATSSEEIQSAPTPTQELTPSQSQQALATKAAVERKLVSLILSAPSHKLPKAFVDPATGIIRNNVQVMCRLAMKRTYRCAIKAPSAGGSRAQLFVRYRVRQDGKGVFYWSKLTRMG